MNEKKKLKVVLAIIVILSLLSILLIFLTSNKNDENEKVRLVHTDFKEIRNDSEIFTIQNMLNDYYRKLTLNDKDSILKVLNDQYISDNNLDSTNVLNKLGKDVGDISFYLNDAFYYNRKGLTYYVARGYYFEYFMTTEELKYEKNITFFIICDTRNNLYSVYPLEKDTYWEDFINKYESSNNENLKMTYKNVNISDENKLKTYINIFLNLLYLDNAKAFEMLDTNTQQYYGSKENFKTNVDGIYDRISPTVFSYSVQNKSKYKVYDIIDNKQNHIVINEEKTMNYTISLEF